ncbi:MAG TPA: anthranilate phosphoribosyltransferase, partial [Acidimicrobiales bacterium]|nr:anthranilate phosphoribosyltransferase [Acidimicrobiales bacterium]
SYVRRQYEIDPRSFGLAAAEPADLAGGSAELNAELLRSVFAGERGPRRDFALLNSAAALVVGGAVDDLGAGLDLAGSLIDDGSVAGTLDELIRVSSEAAQGEQG